MKKALNHKPTRHILIYNNEEYDMHIPPDYYDVTSMETVMKDIKADNEYTECTFITTWTIEDKKLYLLDVLSIGYHKNSHREGRSLMKELFESEKVKATWVKEHVISVICKDEDTPMKLHITISNGVVINEEKRSYRKIQKKN